MTSKKYRPLNDEEKSALLKILRSDFSGNMALSAQIDSLLILPIDETLFELYQDVGASDIETVRKTYAVPVECTYHDSDKKIVFVFLFVDQHDHLAEIEIWKPDGSAVETYFAKAELTITPERRQN